MIQKHIILFNPKGGVGKSTLCERTAMQLLNLGHTVSVENTDQQVHVELRPNDTAEFCLYDTMGAYSSRNMELLASAAEAGSEAKIIVPTGTSKNDFKDIDFLKSKLDHSGLLDRTIFVFTKVRATSLALKKKRLQLDMLDLKHCAYVMPLLEDFSEERDTPRTRNELTTFINEVIL